LFNHFAVKSLTAGVFTDNPASARVLLACGFVLIGEEMHQSRGRLAPAPAQVYRLSNPLQTVAT
ncbi:MAG: GNAT family N-acetyltransferase, partial [Pseudorhodobacter sp.]|nr:GNAT family N-acetyltransferase [Pseudorhodobacter sp.]